MVDTTAAPARPRRPMRADSARAWAAFCARVEELGGIVVEPYFLNSRTRHRVVCRAGHECTPTPQAVTAGYGLCKICTSRDPRTAEAAFRDRLQELGATLMETAYLGSKEGHRVICAEGHECRPRPKDLQQGDGLCRECAADRLRGRPQPARQRGPGSVQAEARFRARIAELNGTVLGAYVSIDVPVLVRCAEGHEVTPLPGNVLSGHGPCRICGGKAWDVFYVVLDGEADTVKFGITSGDPRPRLAAHEADGFSEVVRLHAGLTGDTAPVLERVILAALRDAGEAPVRGREYFHARVLGLVLDLVDHHPAINPAGSQVLTG